MSNRVYTSLKGVKVNYDELMRSGGAYKREPAKTEVVKRAREVADKRKINGHIPAPAESPTPIELTTVKVEQPKSKQEKPKIAPKVETVEDEE